MEIMYLIVCFTGKTVYTVNRPPLVMSLAQLRQQNPNFRPAVRGQLTGGVRGQLTGGVRGQLAGGVRGQLAGGVRGQLAGGVRGQLAGGVRGQLRPVSIRPSFRACPTRYPGGINPKQGWCPM